VKGGKAESHPQGTLITATGDGDSLTASLEETPPTA
jgi:hypothetical protein